jgi:hypothetical protein
MSCQPVQHDTFSAHSEPHVLLPLHVWCLALLQAALLRRCADIIAGLTYLHSRNVCHGDLKVGEVINRVKLSAWGHVSRWVKSAVG